MVTGGIGGLGQRVCLALAKSGCDVAVLYANSRDGAEQVATDLRSLGVCAEAIGCDVTSEQQVPSMVSDGLAKFGLLDILVNDAAYNKWITFQDLDALTHEVWQKILGVNLTGPMLCIRAAADAMRKQAGGRIVSTTSIAGLAPSGPSITYAVSEAGLIHLTRAWRWHSPQTSWSAALRRLP